MKLFISYSHEDTAHLDELKKHLVTLERQNVLQSWHDAKIVAGDVLDAKIYEKISTSDIIVFLISVDFLSSFYCYEKELMATLNGMSDSGQRIFPIILRNCDWQDGVISKYKCVTVDDKPVCSHANKDEAWMAVIKQMKSLILDLKKKDEAKKTLIENKESIAAKYNTSFLDQLDSTPVLFHHQNKNKLSLSDIFIYPQLKKLSEDIEKIDFALDSEKTLLREDLSNRILIVGEEQIGKTSLAYMLLQYYFKNGLCPLYIDGSKVSTSNPISLIKQNVSKQYDSVEYEIFARNDELKIVVIDDFHHVSINEKAQSKLIKELYSQFDKVIIFTDNTSRYIDSDIITLSDYEQYEILPFGHKLKNDLINKWNSLGQEETIDARELHTQNNITTQHLNSIVRKNVLQSKPIYLLTVLQSIDSAKPNDYSLTSYGHCYQYLITQNFEKSSIRASELDTLFNYITELSFYIYSLEKEKIDKDEFQFFSTNYSEKFYLKSHDSTLEKLIKAGILKETNDSYVFSYKYIYYFYVAKYLAENLKNPVVVDIVENLCANLHVEKNANILIFLTHHSKDDSIIDDIYLHVSEIFRDVEIVKLDREDTNGLQEFIDLIPEKVYKQRDVEKERQRYFEGKDRYDANNSGNERDEAIENCKDDNILLSIFQSFKSIDIVGQILRNRYGSLTKDQLNDLGKVSIASGFKLLKFFLKLTESVRNEILSLIEKMIKENGNKKDDDLIKEAKKVYLAMNYGMAYGVIRKIAKSIGSEAIIDLSEELRDDFANSPAFRILEISIILDFQTQIPKKKIEQLFADLEAIPIAKRLLRDTIIQHVHLHHTNYQDKQWINNILGITMNNQRLIDSKVHQG